MRHKGYTTPSKPRPNQEDPSEFFDPISVCISPFYGSPVKPPATVGGDATIMTIVPFGSAANHRRRRPAPMNQYGHAGEYEEEKDR
jgi:hypothetical protein